MEFESGACYSNGGFGRHWEVRQVLTVAGEGAERHIHYKVLVGEGRRRRASCPFDEFRRWSRYRVVRNENSWERLDGTPLG